MSKQLHYYIVHNNIHPSVTRARPSSFHMNQLLLDVSMPILALVHFTFVTKFAFFRVFMPELASQQLEWTILIAVEIMAISDIDIVVEPHVLLHPPFHTKNCITFITPEGCCVMHMIYMSFKIKALDPLPHYTQSK